MVCTLVPEATLLAQTAFIKKISIILSVVVALIAMLLGTVIARSMSGTIQYILRQLRKVSKGNLTVHLTGKRKDKRVIVVVLGSSSSNERDKAARRLLSDALGSLAW